MNICELIRQRIVKDILKSFNSKWAVLIYDKMAAGIIENLFKKTDFIQHNIIASHHIEEVRSSLEYPAVYFVSGGKEVSKIINNEMKEMKYIDCKVFSLFQPDGLNQAIPYSVVNLNIRALEERVFICEPRDLSSCVSILESKINVNYTMNTDIAISIINNANRSQGSSFAKWSTALLLERNRDMITPLLHFFTFKSVLFENKEVDIGNIEEESDPIFSIIRYQNLIDVEKTLKSHVAKLNREMEKLNTGKVDTEELELMVLNAPNNMKIKKSLGKYSKLLGESIKKLGNMKELVEMEQELATGYDRKQEKIKICMEHYFSEFKGGKFSLEEKLRLLYMLKIRGYRFTNTEKEMLKSCRIPVKDIECQLDLRLNVLKNKKEHSKYMFGTRYVPVIYDIIKDFLSGKTNIFKQANENVSEIVSLRKSRMMTVDRVQEKRVVLVYVRGGSLWRR